MSYDSESNLESRLQQQLSNRAEAFPSKPDRLDVVRARGRRRQLVSRSALTIAGLAVIVAVAGLGSTLLDAPAESTSAVGSPELGIPGNPDDFDDLGGKPRPTIVANTDTTEVGSPDDPASGGLPGGSDGELLISGDEPLSFASFGGICMSAPALPDVSISDPGKRVVRVASEAELQTAVSNLSANTAVLLAPGTYQLSETLVVRADNVTIRGDSDRCDEVVLVGKGMDNAAGDSSVPHGIFTDASNLKVQNLTIRDVYRHSITVDGNGYAPQIYNVRLVNAGEQFIKVNPRSFGQGVDDGVVDYVVLIYPNGPPTTDHGAGIGYTQGVDIHAGQGWTIRNSRFENMHTPDDSDWRVNPAVLMWNGASDTTVESNVFVDVDRAIAFGLEQSRPGDHSGGVIRNNMIVQRDGLYSQQRRNGSDASIIVWNSPGTQVLHNTILNQGNNVKAIELRFDTDGVVVRNNLVDSPVLHRENREFVSAGNVNIDGSSMFRNPALGDLHLTGPVEGIVDAVTATNFARYDFDGHLRSNDDAVDVGADELVEDRLPPEVAMPPTTVTPPSTTAPSTTTALTTTSQTSTTGPSNTTPPNNELVARSDFQYQGSFRVPYGGGDETTTLAYGGAGLAYNAAKNSLFITGHDWHQLTAEISIPALGTSSNSSNLPQASFLQTPVDATDGKLPNITSPPEDTYGRIGGYLVDGNDLIVSGYDYYDASDDQVRSHMLTDVNLGSSSSMVSLADDLKSRWLGGAMAVIPDEWQAEFGGDTYVTGLAGISIAGNSSVGPAAATFTQASLSGRDPAKLVLGYPLEKALDGPETKNEVWNLTSTVTGMVFPKGTSSLLYFGTHGTGEYCYGSGANCGDPVNPYQGTHAYPYRYQVWAYDADDLTEVFGGQAAPESVRPYGVWEFEMPYSPDSTAIGGVAYDPASGRIFISQGFADSDHPVIHVYTLG